MNELNETDDPQNDGYLWQIITGIGVFVTLFIICFGWLCYKRQLYKKQIEKADVDRAADRAMSRDEFDNDNLEPLSSK